MTAHLEGDGQIDAQRMSVIMAMQAELLNLPEETPALERLGVVFQAYSRAEGKPLPANPSAAQRAAVNSWLHRQELDDLVELGVTRQPIFRHLMHTTTSSKASSLACLACPSCGPRRHSFPVDVDPWSAQSTKLKVEIRQGASKLLAEAQSGRGVPLYPTAPICISIVAVVPVTGGGAGMKDADNLVKGLLDAMAGIIYSNDKQVQCLAVRRLEHSGAHGFYAVALREAEALEDDVIYDDPAGPVIAWGARSAEP